MPVLGGGLYVGTDPVVSAYVGTEQVWSAGAPLNRQIGIAPGMIHLTVDNPTHAALAADLVDLGVDWLRIPVPWSAIEYEQGSYHQWEYVDRSWDAAIAAGQKVIADVSFTPAWARSGGTDRQPPTDPSTYADFCAVVAQRYPGMVLELWNEPNNPPFWTTPNAAAYAGLIEVAYPAIKAARPSTLVLSGGIGFAPGGPDPHTFLADVYTALDGATAFDAVAAHPYCWPAFPSSPGSAWLAMSLMRDAMSANGDTGKRIWITEMGAPTGSNGEMEITEQDQADMLTEAYNLWFGYDWAGPMCWYSHLSTGTTPGEETFGILTNTGTRKLAWYAMQELT